MAVYRCAFFTCERHLSSLLLAIILANLSPFLPYTTDASVFLFLSVPSPDRFVLLDLSFAFLADLLILALQALHIALSMSLPVDN